MYDKILHLQQLNLELNGKSKTWKQLSNLTNQSLKVLLNQEKIIENKSKIANRFYQREFLIENIGRQDKAKLVDKRYLSDGQLEMTFLKAGETFTKLYDTESYEYKRNKKREEKEHEEAVQHLHLQDITENFFNN